MRGVGRFKVHIHATYVSSGMLDQRSGIVPLSALLDTSKCLEHTRTNAMIDNSEQLDSTPIVYKEYIDPPQDNKGRV